MGYSFRLAANFFYMHHPTDKITHSTAFVTPVVEHWLEREIAQCVHHEGSIRRPIAPWANALTTELHLAPRGMRVNLMFYGSPEQGSKWIHRSRKYIHRKITRTRQCTHPNRTQISTTSCWSMETEYDWVTFWTDKRQREKENALKTRRRRRKCYN